MVNHLDRLSTLKSICILNNHTDNIRPQIREQMSGPELHIFTFKFLDLKKLVFPNKKNPKII